ncbi:MAG: FtsX-like permease family protein, partial [Erysipelotrichales bacterium]
FKLAIQNMRRSKGYFIAYILTVAVFFTIIYQVSNIEVQLADYFLDSVKMSQININEIFKYLKIFLYAIVIFFAAYIARFFIKRRSKEVALLKVLGLNRNNIWYIFLIENIIIIVLGIILGLIFGVLISRFSAMIAFDMMGLDLLESKFTLVAKGIKDVGIIALITYSIISLIPLKTITKSSIIELFNDQVKNDEIKKKPLLSTIIFFIALLFLLIEMFVIFPHVGAFGIGLLMIYFLNAIVVAWFLYKGPLTYFFLNFKKKQKGIGSPIRLLSYNHLGSKLSALSRMMSFITIVSATMVAMLIFTFGMINSMTNFGDVSQEVHPKLKIFAKDKKDLDKIAGELDKKKEPYTKLSIYSYGQTKLYPNDENHESNEFKSHGAIAIKESDYNKLLKADGFKEERVPKNKEFLVKGKKNFNKKSANLKKVINSAGYNINGGAYKESGHEILDFFMMEDIKDASLAKYDLSLRLLGSDIVVLKDDNPVFKKLTKIEVLNLENKITKDNAFSMFNIIHGNKSLDNDKVELSNDIEVNMASSYIALGLFQLIFLMASIVVTLALMMAIFFRTLENLEASINDYVIAKQVGLKKSQITVSIFIEAFISQLLPFLVGGLVSILMVNQMFANKIPGLNTIWPLLKEPATASILLGLCAFLFILLIVLMYSVLKEIYRLKAVKTD